MTSTHQPTFWGRKTFPSSLTGRNEALRTFAWVHVEDLGSVGARHCNKLILIHLSCGLHTEQDGNQ